MKKLLYKWALAFVEKQKVKDKERAEALERKEKREREERQNFYKTHREIIRSFSQRFCRDIQDQFSRKTPAKFSIGQKVLLNPYSAGDPWEGSVKMMLSNTPFSGPVEVIIDSVGVDTGRLYEMITEIWSSQDERFNSISSSDDVDYQKFSGLVRIKMSKSSQYEKYQWASYSYGFHRPEDPEKKFYWRFPLREDKFVSPESEEGKEVIKLGILEGEIKTKKEAVNKAKEEYDLCMSEFRKRLGIVYQEK